MKVFVPLTVMAKLPPSKLPLATPTMPIIVPVTHEVGSAALAITVTTLDERDRVEIATSSETFP